MTRPKAGATPARRRSELKQPTEGGTGDQHIIEGRVSGHAVIVQGRGARVEITQVYRGQTPTQAEQAELKDLRTAVLARCEEWQAAAAQPSLHDNPYHLLQSLDCSDGAVLAGREASVSALTDKLRRQRAVFLTGEDGVGTSSLICAGLIPVLLADGHLPLYLSASDAPLDAAIRRSLVSSPERFPYLGKRSLEDFLRLTTAFVPANRSLVVIIDDLQHFFGQPQPQQSAFLADWSACLLPTGPRVRWLFCLPLDQLPRLGTFQPVVNPYADLSVLQRLDREAARSAILRPLDGRDVQVDPTLVEDILDRLGPTAINPAELQIVCHGFAMQAGSLRKRWSLADYQALGSADGILNTHLERALERFPAPDREPAWRLLSILAARHREKATETWLFARLASYGEQSADSHDILERLHANYLVCLQDGAYHLSSSILLPRIRQWTERQAALVEARQEAARQLQEFRLSALRGSLGGALGFGLFRWIAGNPARDPLAVVFFTLLYATIGALVGILLALASDLVLAAFRGPRRWLTYPVLALAGAAVFALALSLFDYLGSATEILHLVYACLLGGLWGAIAGTGVAWSAGAPHRWFWRLLVAAAASGVMLVLGNSLLRFLTSSSPWELFLAGVLFPLLVIGSISWRTEVNVH